MTSDNKTSMKKSESDRHSHYQEKSNWEKAAHIATVFNSFSVVVAVVTLAISIYPQLILKNTNHIERANAGDVHSQMFLADHYYEIGDYGESIYWYKIASTAETSDYRYYAYNNLGYLYAKGFGFSNNFNEELCRFEKALLLFQKSEENIEKSRDNICKLLRESSKDDFPNISNHDYDTLLAQYDVNSSIESVSYEYSDISYGSVFWKDNKKYVGGQLVSNPNGGSRYVYRVYTLGDNTEIDFSAEDYVYIGFDEITNS